MRRFKCWVCIYFNLSICLQFLFANMDSYVIINSWQTQKKKIQNATAANQKDSMVLII